MCWYHMLAYPLQHRCPTFSPRGSLCDQLRVPGVDLFQHNNEPRLVLFRFISILIFRIFRLCKKIL